MPPKGPRLFTNVEEESLIGVVQNTPAIWNKTDSDYKKRDKRSEWVTVGRTLNKDGPDCKLVWTSLRQQFSSFLRRLAKPSGTAAGRRPYFRHENLMAFIKDQIAPTESTVSNVEDIEDESQDEDLDGEGNEDSLLLGDGDVVFNEDELREAGGLLEGDNRAPDLLPPPVVHQRPAPSPRPNSHSRPQHRSHSTSENHKRTHFDEELIGMLRESEGKHDDEYDAFGKLVSNKLRFISSKKRRVFLELQQDISHKIMEAELDVLD